MSAEMFMWRCPSCQIRQKQRVKPGGPVHTLVCKACGRLIGHREIAQDDRRVWLQSLARVLTTPGRGEFWPSAG